MTIKVIGIGNPFRRDDGAGIVAVQTIKRKQNIKCVATQAEPTELLNAWMDADAVIILDAAAPTGAPGRITRIVVGDETLPPESPVASTHALGLMKTIDLANTLGQAPDTIILFAIEGEDFSYGDELSRDVEQAIPNLVDRALQEVARLTEKETTHA